MRLRQILGGLILVGALSFAPPASAADKLTTSEAKQHIGQTATVCGIVASARYSERARGKPTFLDIDKAYPQQIFTVVIWGENRSNLALPSGSYATSESVCVTGRIQQYRGEPEIVASEPRQIERQ